MSVFLLFIIFHLSREALAEGLSLTNRASAMNMQQAFPLQFTALYFINAGLASNKNTFRHMTKPLP
jgi:hypothetical protein